MKDVIYVELLEREKQDLELEIKECRDKLRKLIGDKHRLIFKIESEKKR